MLYFRDEFHCKTCRSFKIMMTMVSSVFVLSREDMNAGYRPWIFDWDSDMGSQKVFSKGDMWMTFSKSRM